ncbi:MAG: glycosyl transferase, family 2 [Acidobacteriales bacterium]|nr:glycosyl transferase, family 2 [Terriglobales bacterium]
MHQFHSIAGGLLGAVWFWRLVDAALGMPKVDDINRPEWDVPTGQSAPRVTVVVPARNEAEGIQQCLSSLLALDYPNYEVIAVNDRSTDRTGEIMDEIAATEAGKKRLKVIHVTELPARWLGKTHAMWTAGLQATGEWILFTDGDVVYRADTIRRAIAYAEKSAADHLVLFPTMIMKSAGERMMIGLFQIMFVFGNRPWKVADPDAFDFIGVGAFNMIRKSAYEKIGTFEIMRLEVVDDLWLGKAVKQHRLAQRIVFGSGLISLRWAKGAMGVVGNLTKNFFALMRFNWAIALGAALALAFLNLGPFVGIALAPGWQKLGYGVALASIAGMYCGMSRKSKVSPIYFFAHPIGAVLLIYTLVKSTWLALTQGGVTWRGTKYGLAELKSKA